MNIRYTIAELLEETATLSLAGAKAQRNKKTRLTT